MALPISGAVCAESIASVGLAGLLRVKKTRKHFLFCSRSVVSTCVVVEVCSRRGAELH